MNIISEKTKYVIIQFENEYIEGKPVVDLVPRSWIVQEEKSVFCFYPINMPQRQLLNVVEKGLPPESSWQKYPVEEIIAQASKQNS